MKTNRLLLLILGLAIALFALLPNLAWAADDGASLFKAKCAVCHGADAAGRPAAKVPSLISTDAKKMSDAALTDAIANGGKDKKPMHTFSKKGLSPDQIKSLVAYIRTLQK
ncbi:MAG TPA: cytochrome c [Terriglobales bacterium]|nr:cytochrome c [Terriglobales bacterium]